MLVCLVTLGTVLYYIYCVYVILFEIVFEESNDSVPGVVLRRYERSHEIPEFQQIPTSG